MAIRRAFVILTMVLAALATGSACSETARYRALRFFFDGVPDPSAAPPEADAAPGADAATQTQEAAAPPARAGKTYTHPPFRDNRCGACHNRLTGQLVRSPEQGLCGTCHTDLPGEVRWVHGPVAVKACLFCHHHHSSRQPALLLKPVTDLCLQCHDRARIMSAAQHAAADTETCIACHNPHGADNRFFLKSGEQ